MALNFGTPSSAPATTSLGGGFSFGANKPTFGVGSTPTTGFSFGTPASTAAPAFGTSTGFGAPLTTTTGLNFAPPASTATSSAAPAGLNFGGIYQHLGCGGGFYINSSTKADTSTTTQIPIPASTATPLLGFKTTAAATVTQPSLTGAPPFTGLGGLEASGTTNLPGIGGRLGAPGGSSNASKSGAKEQPRHQKLSNELLETVDTFKTFVKQQKSLSSDVAKASVEPLHKVTKSLDVLSTSVLTATGNVRTSRATARRLRESSSLALAMAEEAGTGGMLPSDATTASPPDLLRTLVAEHEASVRRFARQVDAVDRQMHGGVKTLAEQDLILGMRWLHEMLVALAGRLAALGTRVNELKQFYLNLRKHRLHLTDDVFQQHTQTTDRDFTTLSNALKQFDDSKQYLSNANVSTSASQRNSIVISDPRLALGLPTYQKSSIAGPTPFTYLGPPGFGGYPFGYTSPTSENKPLMNPANTTGFGLPWAAPQQAGLGFTNPNTSLLFSGSNPVDNQSGFQLQKPPTGYKKGKH